MNFKVNVAEIGTANWVGCDTCENARDWGCTFPADDIIDDMITDGDRFFCGLFEDEWEPTMEMEDE